MLRHHRIHNGLPQSLEEQRRLVEERMENEEDSGTIAFEDLWRNRNELGREIEDPTESIYVWLTNMRDLIIRVSNVIVTTCVPEPALDNLILRIREVIFSEYLELSDSAQKMYNIIKNVLKNKQLMESEFGIQNKAMLIIIKKNFMETYNTLVRRRIQKLKRSNGLQLDEATKVEFSNEVVNALPITVGVPAQGNTALINMAYLPQVEGKPLELVHPSPTNKYFPIFNSKSPRRASRGKSTNRASRGKSTNRGKSLNRGKSTNRGKGKSNTKHMRRHKSR